ncbi:MAG: chloride channel protein [Acidimicrobiales bacterium]
MRPSLPRRSFADAVVHVRNGLGPAVVAVGIGGGLVGAAYVATLHGLQHVLGPGDHRGIVQLAVLVVAGAAVAVITRLAGETGDVELLVDNIHVLGGAEDTRRLRSLIPASLLCVASGGAMGPEAPLVQSTGTLGTWVGSRLGRSRPDVRILTITGMAAGFTVLFGAPLGSALFALEILHRRGLQYYEALLPAVVGSLCGYGVYIAVSGAGIEPVWSFGPVATLHGGDLALAAAVGVAGAIGAALFTTLVLVARRILGAVPRSGRYVLGGLLLGLLGLWSPYALTFGEDQLGGLLDVRLAAGALAVALLAKLAGTTVTLASGWKGGFIIPLFFMGATLGQLVHAALPGTNETVLMTTMMVALCVGVTKTPLGTTLVVTEMAGLPLLPVTLIAAIVALVLSRPVTLIETQRARHPEREAPA